MRYLIFCSPSPALPRLTPHNAGQTLHSKHFISLVVCCWFDVRPKTQSYWCFCISSLNTLFVVSWFWICKHYYSRVFAFIKKIYKNCFALQPENKSCFSPLDIFWTWLNFCILVRFLGISFTHLFALLVMLRSAGDDLSNRLWILPPTQLD